MHRLKGSASLSVEPSVENYLFVFVLLLPLMAKQAVPAPLRSPLKYFHRTNNIHSRVWWCDCISLTWYMVYMILVDSLPPRFKLWLVLITLLSHFKVLPDIKKSYKASNNSLPKLFVCGPTTLCSDLKKECYRNNIVYKEEVF